MLAGVDEETALVKGPDGWSVAGAGAVTLYGVGGTTDVHRRRRRPPGLPDMRRAELVAELLREVVGLAELADEAELGLEPVGVVFLAFEDLLEQLAGAVVAELRGTWRCRG